MPSFSRPSSPKCVSWRWRKPNLAQYRPFPTYAVVMFWKFRSKSELSTHMVKYTCILHGNPLDIQDSNTPEHNRRQHNNPGNCITWNCVSLRLSVYDNAMQRNSTVHKYLFYKLIFLQSNDFIKTYVWSTVIITTCGKGKVVLVKALKASGGRYGSSYFGTRWRWVVGFTHRPLCPPVPIE